MRKTVNWNRVNNEMSTAVLKAGLLDSLLHDLGCDLKTRDHVNYRGPCPVHGGDSDSMCLKVGEDDTIPIRWNCFSCQCHEEFKPSLLGLVRGVLSEQNGRKVPLNNAVDYLSRYVRGVAVNRACTHKPKKVVPPKLLNLTREAVRHALAIPSPYFLTRGFQPSVLDRFDVGESAKLGRAVVPLYDIDDGRTCVGFVARSYRPGCDVCRNHHDGPDCRYGQRRWVMSKGFPAERYLFNYAAARASNAEFVLLVEGVGDVFRAAESGLVGVALLGKQVSGEQLRLLAALGKEIWVAFDNDMGGDEARARLSQQVNDGGVELPFVSFWAPKPFKDIGETPVDELQKEIRERLQGLVELDEALFGSGGDPRDQASLEKWRRRLESYEAWMSPAGQ